MPLIMTVLMFLYFFVRELVCVGVGCNYESSFIGLAPIITGNYLNMILLSTVAGIFIYKINMRYGSIYKKTQYTIATYLTLFTLSFLIRGASDTMLLIEANQDTMTFPFIHSAVYSFFFYFMTEWLPLAVMFATHIIQWRAAAFHSEEELVEEDVRKESNIAIDEILSPTGKITRKQIDVTFDYTDDEVTN